MLIDAKRVAICLLILLVVGASANGSAATEKGPQNPDQLEKRAVGRWRALIAGDFERAYEFLSPGYREVHSLKSYRGTFGNTVDWKEVNLNGISCKQKDTCTVRVKVTFQYSEPNFEKITSEQALREKWIHSQSQWWYVPED